MTESIGKDFHTVSEENETVSSAVACSSIDLEVVSAAAVSNNGKNEIRVGEEGVAKLKFSFLEDMQGGDSSLEPGEVKTPPPGSSPAATKELTPSRLAAKPDPPAKVFAKEALAKAMKTVSQMEAEACEEKVRAILELDAKRRKEERKLEAEKKRQTEKTDVEVERKRLAKEERKKLKKLKKDKKAAEKGLLSCEEDEDKSTLKTVKTIESEDSEGLCSSGPDDSNENNAISALSSAIAIPNMSMRYPSHMPPSHMPPDAFMSGFRPMNPFMRVPRPDFSHGRGGFMPRGRGILRGRMPFQGFRPPFFAGGGNPSGGPPRHHTPYGPHGLHHASQLGPSLQRHPHTPPPNRGHSPILPPSSDLQWTKCKPSLSYAFKVIKEHKFHVVQPEMKPNTTATTFKQNAENWCEDPTNDGDDNAANDNWNDNQHKSHRKKNKSLTKKQRKKAKKTKEKDTKKHKRNRSTRSSSLKSLATKNKKSNKSSRRKIEKIRKSYGTSNRSTPQQQQHSSEDTETTTETHLEEEEEMEDIPNAEEIKNKVENIKREKLEMTVYKIEDLTLKVKPLIIKIEPEEKEKLEDKEEQEQEKDKDKEVDNEKVFDMFADSPPLTAANSKEVQIHPKEIENEDSSVYGCKTPPLPKLHNQKLTKSSLQNALEIQKRIDKLLQQDDIKLEALEAAKEQLLKKTQKHQSTKDHHYSAKKTYTPDREMIQKDAELKIDDKSKNTSTLKNDEEIVKEKPKAYKKNEEILKEKPKAYSEDIAKHKSKERGDSNRLKEEKDEKYVPKQKESDVKDSSSLKDKDKIKNKDKDYDKDKDKDKDKEKTRKDVITNYRNPFKRSLSRDRFFGRIDVRRRTNTKSRERDSTTKRRLSNDRKRGDSSGYSSGRLSSKRRFSGSGSASTTIFNRSKSGERDIKGSSDSISNKDREHKNYKRGTTPDIKYKRKHSSSPKRKIEKDKEKEKDTSAKMKSKNMDEKLELIETSTTPPHPKVMKKDVKTQDKKKDNKKSKSPIIKMPLSFTQTEFLFPGEGNDDELLLNEDDETNDSFGLPKSPSDKEDSPDTDDYMDNWENDEDVDLDINSNTPGDSYTPRRSSPDLTEQDSFVTRFANPSPPSELVQNQTQVLETDTERFISALTPPLDLLKTLPVTLKDKEKLSESTSNQIKESQIENKTELFGMQELYDQFIKSVEASGVNMKSASTETPHKELDAKTEAENNALKRTDDPLSTSSTSTSSTNSSASSSSDTNSSSSTSSSSSSASSSDDSNDADRFRQSKKTPKKPKLEELNTTTSIKNEKTQLSEVDNMTYKQPATPPLVKKREPRTPSPIPLQKNLFIAQTPTTPSSQIKQPKSDVAKDFKKLKSLEANLSRIQMMRANYDSNDEISEELQKMEILFLQEKKLILQKYAKNSQTDKSTLTSLVTPPSKVISPLEFVPALPISDLQSPLPPPPPPAEPNKIFDANREAIKLTISPMKLPSKPAIFNTSTSEELERRSKCVEDKDEMDFTEKLVKPAKEVAIVKPMMETKESKESRSRDSQRQRRSPAYGNRDRPRSPTNYRDRNRRSTSRTRFSPQRRGRGRSLSSSPPRRAGNIRHGTPPRRGAPGARFRVSNRRSRSRSRSRSPLRQFGNRRGLKDGSPFRRKRAGVQQQDTQMHYKKFPRHRGSRSRSPRSPQARPRSPRTPPPRRRSYSQDRYSRSPLPFKPPSPPMRRSLSPMDSPNSQVRRSRSPPSPRRPRSPRSPRSPLSPRSPRSPRSPTSSPPCSRYDDHKNRRENSFERTSSISPHAQYYPHHAIASGVAAQTSSYYYNVSPNRISLDARINIVLNGPGEGAETPSSGYEGYTNYAQYGGAAYMSIPPQPMSDPNSVGYYPNPYVAMIPTTHEGHAHHHHALPPLPHAMHPSSILPHMSPHPPTYSNIPTINSGISGPSSPANNFYYNEFNMGHHPANPVLKELPKASTSVAVQKGNVLEIVPSSNMDTASTQPKAKIATTLTETIKTQIDKVSSVSWKDEVNIRHVKAAVMRLNREGDSIMRSILKRSDMTDKTDKSEKKKVYFEDGIYPSRDSEDEDRKLIETRIRRKVIRLRRKRGIEIPAARDLVGERRTNKQKPKLDAALEKLPPPPPPAFAPAATLEQPIYLKPPTPVPLVYFHFDSVVHSMYVSQLEKPIPPRLLNPKCVPPGAATSTNGAGAAGGSNPTQSPNVNSPTGSCGAGAPSKKDLTTLSALKRVSRNDNLVTNSPKMMGESLGTKRESPNLQQPSLMSKNKPGSMHFVGGSQTSPQMSPIHAPTIRHPSAPLGFVGMRINNFMRLPPSPLARSTVPSHLQPPPTNMGILPHPSVMSGGGVIRHPQYNMPPPNLMPPGVSPPDPKNFATAAPSSYASIQIPPPGYNFNHRPMNPAYFMGSPTSHTKHPPPPLPNNPHSSHKGIHKENDHAHRHRHQHKPPLPPPPVGNMVAASPQAMIAPFNVNKTVN